MASQTTGRCRICFDTLDKVHLFFILYNVAKQTYHFISDSITTVLPEWLSCLLNLYYKNLFAMSEYGIWCNFEIIFMFGDRLIESL